ncbi:hypothetical protein [Novosphingobium aquae]|uniref:Transposase DDE domain-containing protein n=1 Tax=Novosphingobium aquae TaxID=3133435 RepID=A0ABU8SB23_9SPHN
MRLTWTLERLTRRIDRCYLIATWTRVEVKRATYLQLARYYRSLLANLSQHGQALHLTAA